MSDMVMVALITGILSVLGVIVTNHAGNKDIARKLEGQDNLFEQRLKQLEQKMDRHNSLIERVYRLEERQVTLFKCRDDLSKRIDELKK